MADLMTYGVVTAPILAIVGADETEFMTGSLDGKASDFRVVEVPDSGHYLAEERPETVLAELTGFLGPDPR
jgi:pimeloyl-ACP methyl ester carboxylesterase